MIKELNIDCAKTTQSIVGFLKSEAKRQQKNRAIVGLSGGIDSTVVAFLCKRAGLDIQTVLLPYRHLNQDSLKDARLALEALDIDDKNVYAIDVTPGVAAQLKELKRHLKITLVDELKVKARHRHTILSSLVRHLKGLLVGAENKSEYWLGHFFMRGDYSFDINPISHLWKTQVYHLGHYLKVPAKILKKEPSASHWVGQTDKDILGFSYNDADPILYWFVEREYPPEKIVKKLGGDAKLVRRVINQVQQTAYKRQTPPRGYWL